MFTLLIADDELQIRNGLLSIGWEKEGIRVIGLVDNGMDAIELLQSEIVDVVLTDIRMPAADGISIARFIHEQGLYTDVILLSGYSDFEYARNALLYNVREYLLKPSSPDEIIAAVKRACEHIGKRRENDRRFRMLEEEVKKHRLILDKDGYALGDAQPSKLPRSILRYLNDHSHEPLSLSELSKAFHFSQTYLSKVIKKATGFTFLEVLNAVRVHKAAQLMRKTDQSFAVICSEVGIEDQRYFSQVFKKYFGITPSAYKKQPCAPCDAGLSELIRTIGGEDE